MRGFLGRSISCYSLSVWELESSFLIVTVFSQNGSDYIHIQYALDTNPVYIEYIMNVAA